VPKAETPPGDHKTQTVPKSPAPTITPGQTVEQLRKAAESEDPAAQQELAERLLFGKGVAADPAEATRWTRRAASNGNDRAAVGMGRLHLGEPLNVVEAHAWFTQASHSGEPSLREDALQELDALNSRLSPAEKRQAEARATAIQSEINQRSK
jgi:TPR repeat protein